MTKKNNLDNFILKNSKKVFKNIIFFLEKNNTTQQELAGKIGAMPSTICRSLKNLEKGKPVSTETLFKICYGLDLEIIELFK